MTVLRTSRPQLWSREVPGGWRIVNIRQGGSITPYYLSPEGQRFSSLQAVRSYVATSNLKRTQLREVVEANKERVKIINTGVKAFARFDHRTS